MLEELRQFVLVVDRGTVTGAAKLAHLSQPALSAALKRLESHFGARLLHRGRRGVTLTAAGSELLPRARALLAALEDAKRAIAELEGLRAGEVRIGAGGTAATYLLPSLLSKYRKRHPDVRIVLRELPPEQARAEVERGELDLGVVSDSGGEPWRDDSFVLVAARGRGAPSENVVTFTPGTSTRMALDRHFPEARVVMELGSIAAVKRHVREGVGMALLSQAAVATDLASGRLRRVADPRTPIPRRFCLVHRGTDQLSPAAAALRALLLDARQLRRGAAPQGSAQRRRLTGSRSGSGSTGP